VYQIIIYWRSTHGNQFGSAAILDPAFQPSQDNAGNKSTPAILDFADKRIREAENRADARAETRATRHEHAKGLVEEIGLRLGNDNIRAYIDYFFTQHPPDL
jgi:hypothetical protein